MKLVSINIKFQYKTYGVSFVNYEQRKCFFLKQRNSLQFFQKRNFVSAVQVVVAAPFDIRDKATVWSFLLSIVDNSYVRNW